MLSLIQATRIVLPRDFDVTGGALSSTGTIALWSGSRREVYLYRAHRRERVCESLVLTIVGGAFVGETLELVDAHRKRFVRVTAKGSCKALAAFPLTQLSAAAHQTTRGWMIVGTDSTGKVGRFVVSGRSDEAIYLSREGSVDRQLVHQYSTGDWSAIETQLHWPFRWTMARLATGDTASGIPFSSDTVLSLGSDSTLASKLLALPTIRLDRGFLQQLADPRSDLRAMLVFDDEGRKVRATMVDGALGFLGANIETRSLIALRTSDVRELVVYSWRWRTQTMK